MALPVIAAAIIAAGTVANIYAQYQANKSEAAAIRANAINVRGQMKQLKRAYNREKSIVSAEFDDVLDQQMNIFSRAGVSLEGSPLNLLLNESMKKHTELLDLSVQTEEELKLMDMQAAEMERQTNVIGGSPHNILQGFGTLLGGAAKAASLDR